MLWTHEVGSGLVAPHAESRASETDSGDDAGVEVKLYYLAGGGSYPLPQQ